MEFNGFLTADFDYFKKKDKMTKEEYEKTRNDIKLHFRKYCYELQKQYHKITGGVLELDKEFHSFTKKSDEIAAFSDISQKSKLKIFLNSEFLGVTIELKCPNYEELLQDKKDLIWEFMLSNKHTFIEYLPNIKNVKNIRILSHELNSKNYENIINALKNTQNKSLSLIQIGYLFNKNESIKLGKDIVRNAYDALIKTLELNKAF
ncbi:hypothetical protein ABG79_01049 [Caloramator mitchellensis]|uniref:Uncharacterized protein n=1 Tax=Caloramator mitchellensis TaxID=908809 RepID=A0A0R3K150_CALMK|nr:hypothetical protein [Caloramator mitchellensis]KRQ87246.1 hypothetical protein ABG79_01049 [Caloramator mitchellensis]